MTPPSAVLDRPDAPDTTDISDIPTPNLFLYRTTSIPAEEPTPTRQDVLQAMYDEGVPHGQALSLYVMFRELAEDLALLEANDSTVEKILQMLGRRTAGRRETYLISRQLFSGDSRHPALQRIMGDDVLSEDGTEAHRLLERNLLPDGKHRFVHGFVDECVAGITRR